MRATTSPGIVPRVLRRSAPRPEDSYSPRCTIFQSCYGVIRFAYALARARPSFATSTTFADPRQRDAFLYRSYCAPLKTIYHTAVNLSSFLPQIFFNVCFVFLKSFCKNCTNLRRRNIKMILRHSWINRCVNGV